MSKLHFSRLNWQARLAQVLSALIVSVCGLQIVLKFANMADHYSDFIVGDMAFYGGGKTTDIVIIPTFVIVFCVFFYFVQTIMGRDGVEGAQNPSIRIATVLLWWCVPGVMAIGSFFSCSSSLYSLLCLSAGGIVVIVTCCFVDIKRTGACQPLVYSNAALVVLLLWLFSFTVSLLVGRLWPQSDRLLQVIISYGTNVALLIGSCLFLLHLVRPLPLDTWLTRFGGLFQLILPPLLLVLYPALFVTPDGLHAYKVSHYLIVIICLGIIVGWWDVLKRWYESRNSTESGLLNWSPVAVFALVVALRFGITELPYLSRDDYHFGEKLLGYWSYAKFGFLPYVDFVPPHGLVLDYLEGFLSCVLYEGTAASISEAGRLALVILLGATFFSLLHYTRSLVLAFFSALLMLGRLDYLLFTAILCWWLGIGGGASPSIWLPSWFLTAPIVLLANPGVGALIVLASIPVVVLNAVRLLRSRTLFASLSILILTCFFILTMMIWSPLGQMTKGAAEFVLANGPINMVAYGVPLRLSIDPKVGKIEALYECLRMSFLIVPLLSGLIVIAAIRNRAIRDVAFRVALPIFVFSVLMTGYTMGRIDPGGPSRPGQFAIWGWTVLVPVVVWPLIKSTMQPIYVGLMVLPVTMLACYPYGSFQSFRAAVLPTRSCPKLNSVDMGLHNVGKAFLEEEHKTRLMALKKIIFDRIPPGQTYLDLTNRNAQYFYLGMPPPIPVTAPYNMAPVSQQVEAVERLRKNPPPMVLLKADTIDHGVPTSLRAPLVFRFIMQEYQPEYVKGFIIGVRSGHAPNASSLEVKIRDLSDVNWDKGIGRKHAAFITSDPGIMDLARTGDTICFAASGCRKVINKRRHLNVIELEGPLLDPGADGPPRTARLHVADDRNKLLLSYLWDSVFAQKHLKYVPVAWGLSERSLLKRMTEVAPITTGPSRVVDVQRKGNEYYVTGKDPGLYFDISDLKLSGTKAGLLKFDFACQTCREEPIIQIFWWGDDQEGPSEESSCVFYAKSGTLVVPLDAYPRWLTRKWIKGLRIDLHNPDACSAISIAKISLNQRKAVKAAGL
jgi:hypothetical protein